MIPTATSRNQVIRTCLAAVLWLGCAATAAHGGTLSYLVTMNESLSVLRNPTNHAVAHMAAWIPQHSLMLQRSMPYLELRNTSDAGGLITQFSMNIGDTSKNFDWAKLIEASPGVTFSLDSPDAKSGGIKSDVLTIHFTGFEPGDFVRFRTGLSPDNPNASPLVDYRNTFFHLNGSNDSNNSLTTVTYQTPNGEQTLSKPLPNFSNPMPTMTSMRFMHHYGMDSVMPFSLACSGNSSGGGEEPPPSVPEPSGFVLAGIGLFGLAGWSLRRRASLSLPAAR